MADVIRIHANFHDVSHAKLQAESFDDKRPADRIICITRAAQGDMAAGWGLEYAYLDDNIGDTKTFGKLDRLSAVQVVHLAKCYNQTLHGSLGYAPPNLVLHVQDRWSRRFRGLRYRRNLNLFLRNLSGFRLFFVLGEQRPKRWRGWGALAKRGLLLFEVPPRDLEGPEDIAKLRAKLLETGIQDFGIKIDWLPHDGHLDIAERIGVSTIMTGAAQ